MFENWDTPFSRCNSFKNYKQMFLTLNIFVFIPIMLGLLDVAAAGNGELEGVNV